MQNEYLMHFNPFHDPKNGQFTSGGNGTTRSGARKYQKALNELQKKAFNADIKSKHEAHKEEKTDYKSYKRYKNKTWEDTRADWKNIKKYEDKAWEHFQNSEAFKKEANQYRITAQKILNEAKSKGYTINSKEVLKDAAKGRKIAGYFFGGHIGYNIAENMYGGNKYNMAYTEKYKVRK